MDTLTTQRTTRLLRPLRTALSALSSLLDQHHHKQLYTHPAPPPARRTSSGFPPDTAYSDARPKKRSRASGGRGGREGAPNKRVASLASHALADSASALGAHPPSSSPFKAVARRPRGRAGTTYGSRGASGAASSSSSSAPSTSAALPPPPAPAHHPPPAVPTATSASDLRARLPPSLASSPEALKRILAVLKALENVLLAANSAGGGSAGRGGTKSLGETAAREFGWAIEGEVEACLAAVALSSSDDDGGDSHSAGRSPARSRRRRSGESFSSASSSGEDSSDEDEPAFGGRDRSEYEQERQALVEEWYETVPAHSRRFVLPAHAVSLVVRSFDALKASTGAEPPYAVLEACFEVCLRCGCESEATRFHPSLVSSALRSPPSPASSSSSASPLPVPPALLALLRRSPAPTALLYHALLPTLLSSSFADRLFFHPFLSLSPSSSSSSAVKLAPADAHLVAPLAEVLATVSAGMVRAILASSLSSSSSFSGDDDDEEELDEPTRRMADEVLRRLFSAAIKPALVDALLPALFSPAIGDVEKDRAVQGLERVRAALDEVVAVAAPLLLAEEEEEEEDEPGPAEDLVATLAVVDTVLSSLSLPRPPPCPCPSISALSLSPGARHALDALAPGLLFPALNFDPPAVLALVAALPPPSCSSSSSAARVRTVARALLRPLLGADPDAGRAARKTARRCTEAERGEARGRLRALDEAGQGTSQQQEEEEAEEGEEAEEEDGVFDLSSSNRSRSRSASAAPSTSSSSCALRSKRALSSSSASSAARALQPATKRPRPSPAASSSSASSRSRPRSKRSPSVEVLVLSPSPTSSPPPSLPLPPSRRPSPVPPRARARPEPSRSLSSLSSLLQQDESDEDELDLLLCASFRSPPSYLKRREERRRSSAAAGTFSLALAADAEAEAEAEDPPPVDEGSGPESASASEYAPPPR
ncbi:hypothetical protein JCM8097_003737 [Rhodosporidiobolus ruineniae]